MVCERHSVQVRPRKQLLSINRVLSCSLVVGESFLAGRKLFMVFYHFYSIGVIYKPIFVWHCNTSKRCYFLLCFMRFLVLMLEVYQVLYIYLLMLFLPVERRFLALISKMLSTNQHSHRGHYCCEKD